MSHDDACRATRAGCDQFTGMGRVHSNACRVAHEGQRKQATCLMSFALNASHSL